MGWQMPGSGSAQDWAHLLRECRRAETLARAAERQAVRQGEFAEADYWHMLQCLWRKKATTLGARDR